ncbi:MAG: uncharacterized protein PWQ91_1713 [Eubacteriales bacterium]|nr:uncharacterized protein [Eubacteriales bacterium]
MEAISLKKSVIIGLITGFVNGLLGIGGGTILIPAVVFFMGIRQHVAHGTSLCVILPTAAVSAAVYYWHGNLNTILATKVALAGMAGGYLGARLMNCLSPSGLRRFFGIFMIIAGLKMLL